MVKQAVAVAMMSAAIVSAASAQTKKAGTKSVTNDITVTTPEGVYTGTMEMAVNSGKVSGDMRITVPTEITGKVAGTSKAGVLSLEFPYHMTERNCDGTVRMNIKLPQKKGVATGTMEAFGCGRDEGTKLTGTVALTPVTAKPSK